MIKTDIVIAGSGCAGLYCALHLPKEKEILIITKSDAKESDSYLAQGGMCVMKDESDFDSFMEDTLKAGHYENDRTSVEIMIRSSKDVLNDLLAYGADFQKDENGNLMYTKEGAHSANRIVYHEDVTGKEITDTLYKEVRKRSNITIMERTIMTDIIVKENRCCGVIMIQESGNMESVEADFTVFATGGIGGLYKHSTNYKHLTGDGLKIAKKHGIRLKNMDYVQIHPTSLYRTEPGRSFLISESARGEGAVLLNASGERFVNELLPRDVVTQAILKEMNREGSSHVWLSFHNVAEETIQEHFPNIYQTCLEAGYDITKEPIPVVPAQHYFMGGIHVDSDSRTTMDPLYAVGETSCNGVHGKNRLASNSLLESLVFAQRAARKIAAGKDESL